MKLNQRGIGLIELLVAAAVGAIAALAFADMVVFGMTGAMTTKSAFDFDTFIADARLTLSSYKGCSATVAVPGVFATLHAGQNYGDAGTGQALGTIYQPDGVTPLATTTGNFLSVYNLNFLLYDVGPIDTISPYGNQHLAALYISGTRPGVSNSGAYKNFSVIYFQVLTSGAPSNTVLKCDQGEQAGPPQNSGLAANGTNINGMWTMIRSGDLITNPAPRPGTIDYYIGNGAVTGSPVVVQPPYPGLLSPTQFYYSPSNSSWTGFAVKIW